MSDKMPELLPCPFCGGPAKEEIINHDHYQVRYIQCQHCRNRTQGDGTKAQELAKWNTRATPAGDVGEALDAFNKGIEYWYARSPYDMPLSPAEIKTIRAALTAQSVNGQMLEALKLAEDTLAGYSPLTTQIASNTSKIRFLKGPIRTAIAAAEKAQREG